MTTLLDTLLADATTLEEYEVILEMFGEREAPEWGDKSRKREERRGHFARKVSEAEAMILAWGWGESEALRLKSYYADNMAKCACSMCRSHRTEYRGKRAMALTRQEYASFVGEQEQINEINND